MRNHVKNKFQTYNYELRAEILDGIDHLGDWGLSRQFGLGTRIPFDKNSVIEPLSDSTIYFAYYTIAHHLQGTIDGSKPGICNILPQQMTEEAWDYVFLGKEVVIAAELRKKFEVMRNEFLYWYPLDLRCSAKDLIKNHLIMALFNHAAVWRDFPELWPRGYFCNGYIMVDNQKMGKLLGNFKALSETIKLYSADAVRIGCA